MLPKHPEPPKAEKGVEKLLWDIMFIFSGARIHRFMLDIRKMLREDCWNTHKVAGQNIPKNEDRLR